MVASAFETLGPTCCMAALKSASVMGRSFGGVGSRDGSKGTSAVEIFAAVGGAATTIAVPFWLAEAPGLLPFAQAPGVLLLTASVAAAALAATVAARAAFSPARKSLNGGRGGRRNLDSEGKAPPTIKFASR